MGDACILARNMVAAEAGSLYPDQSGRVGPSRRDLWEKHRTARREPAGARRAL